MKRYLALILGCGIFVCMAFPVKAEAVDLGLTILGRVNSDNWGSVVIAKPGEELLLWFTLKNTTVGSVANNVRIKLDLPSGEANPLVLTLHAVADNASEITQNITINLSGSASSIAYVANGTAEIINNGAHTKVIPDQDGANMSTQYVKIGNVNGGDSSDIQVMATSQIAPRVTVTPATNLATASAVVKSTPSTGVNETLWSTLAWIGVGIGGYSIRKWANKISI